MPVYEYESRSGQRLELLASMHTAPPRRFGRTDGGDIPLPDDDALEAFVAVHGHENVFVRAASLPAVAADKTSRVPIAAPGKLPIAPTLDPCRERGEVTTRNGHAVRKHTIGSHPVYTDMQGRYIIDSNKTADVVSKSQGKVWDG